MGHSLRPWIVAAAAASLAACGTVDDVRQRPVSWSGNFAGSYDALANCIAGASIGYPRTATPMLYPSDRRASVIISMAQTGSVIEEYEVAQVGPTQSRVTVRSTYEHGPFSDRRQREIAGRCARQS